MSGSDVPRPASAQPFLPTNSTSAPTSAPATSTSAHAPVPAFSLTSNPTDLKNPISALRDSSTTPHNHPIHHHSDVKGKPLPYVACHNGHGPAIAKDGVGAALTDTPMSSTPGSPRMSAIRMNSSNSTPRIRPTTLDIPGLTKSKVSPDGKIAQRDVGSKLVIVMVGLPARGKSYITKKMTRYLNWLQHDTKIFNVGEKRRTAASGHGYRLSSVSRSAEADALNDGSQTLPQIAAKLLINGGSSSTNEALSPLDIGISARNLPEDALQEVEPIPRVVVNSPGPQVPTPPKKDEQAQEENGGEEDDDTLDQSANFFDPTNKKAAQLREQCAMETLDDLLDYILFNNGSVGIFDATNSTLARRKQIMERIRQRAGPELNVLFVESLCQDPTLLESNMRLKLSGPDYEGKDPVAALEDFKKRVAIYEKNYVPIGDYEEDNNMPFVKMVDVGRKMISHQVKGFLAGQAVYYLLNFNLAPRMIWITRHGESEDNQAGKIGGDSSLSPNGQKYAQAMTRFIDKQRSIWEVHQADKAAHTHFPPVPGDHTPPNPYYDAGVEAKNFCVWTSMLKRSIQTAEHFCEEDYDIKQMKMLDELNAGIMEGLTYEEIRTLHSDEYERRKQDKLAYRYPGPGGEGYLDIINRVRPVIVELERMTDHCLLVTHRSVARVLIAYFQGLKREDVADLDCPLGLLYQLEPKPYGVEFKAWRYNAELDDFEYVPDYKLRRATSHHA
ncbi:bifunctional 6-phosphofructo-2-kinase/fructose-2,6-bisphosphate 2-phosphatase [Aaosphaeria arxii CBS 175.79]|uniref:Bifunctional 6-phosphofructo-2-kinase/fructose-2,6-bisphosphate 2-phosphatase n=1 Tax=Aaosphaeria arxii CBS 175.79 TaxID=1450172 RepID=A0A6A5XU35_9PLEO|nr:bifunctional 6-phosphofructo-2-kinase/fructose-2,6-bisphosphate 2-phosphatase [Aaosphaeria arxii CBS 175.79]KAF2016463.1 bifunctional 6-phosphofructo-2-kinase/fructose-2,6-bisphosphate 2-phosphatase [Aaosphaeria arxii CBS 175.79]